MGVHHSSNRDISALNKATIVDAAEILLAEKTPEANKDDDDFEIALQGMACKISKMGNLKKCFEDIITFGVNKYFNGNFEKLESESLDFQEELHAKMIKYLMHLRDTSRPEDELDVSKDYESWMKCIEG